MKIVKSLAEPSTLFRSKDDVNDVIDRSEVYGEIEKKFQKFLEEPKDSPNAHVTFLYGVGGVGKTFICQQTMMSMRGDDRIDWVVYYDLSQASAIADKLFAIASLIELELNSNGIFPVFGYAYNRYCELRSRTISLAEARTGPDLLQTASSVAGAIPVLSDAVAVVSAAKEVFHFGKSLSITHKNKGVYKAIDQCSYLELEESFCYLFSYDLRRIMGDKKLVIILDTFESVQTAKKNELGTTDKFSWLFGPNGIVCSLPGVFWIIAGRNRQNWIAYSEWNITFKDVAVKAFSKDVVIGWLQKLGVDEKEVQAINAEIGGQALKLQQFARFFRSVYNSSKGGLVSEYKKFLDSSENAIVNNRVLEYYTDDERYVCGVLASLCAWDDNLISALFGNDSKLQTAYRNLQNTEFIKNRGERLYSLSIVNAGLNADIAAGCASARSGILYDNVLRAVMSGLQNGADARTMVTAMLALYNVWVLSKKRDLPKSFLQALSGYLQELQLRGNYRLITNLLWRLSDRYDVLFVVRIHKHLAHMSLSVDVDLNFTDEELSSLRAIPDDVIVGLALHMVSGYKERRTEAFSSLVTIFDEHCSKSSLVSLIIEYCKLNMELIGNSSCFTNVEYERLDWLVERVESVCENGGDILTGEQIADVVEGAIRICAKFCDENSEYKKRLFDMYGRLEAPATSIAAGKMAWYRWNNKKAFNAAVLDGIRACKEIDDFTLFPEFIKGAHSFIPVIEDGDVKDILNEYVCGIANQVVDNAEVLIPKITLCEDIASLTRNADVWEEAKARILAKEGKTVIDWCALEVCCNLVYCGKYGNCFRRENLEEADVIEHTLVTVLAEMAVCNNFVDGVRAFMDSKEWEYAFFVLSSVMANDGTIGKPGTNIVMAEILGLFDDGVTEDSEKFIPDCIRWPWGMDAGLDKVFVEKTFPMMKEIVGCVENLEREDSYKRLKGVVRKMAGFYHESIELVGIVCHKGILTFEQERDLVRCVSSRPENVQLSEENKSSLHKLYARYLPEKLDEHEWPDLSEEAKKMIIGDNGPTHLWTRYCNLIFENADEAKFKTFAEEILKRYDQSDGEVGAEELLLLVLSCYDLVGCNEEVVKLYRKCPSCFHENLSWHVIMSARNAMDILISTGDSEAVHDLVEYHLRNKLATKRRGSEPEQPETMSLSYKAVLQHCNKLVDTYRFDLDALLDWDLLEKSKYSDSDFAWVEELLKGVLDRDAGYREKCISVAARVLVCTHTYLRNQKFRWFDWTNCFLDSRFYRWASGLFSEDFDKELQEVYPLFVHARQSWKEKYAQIVYKEFKIAK